MVEVGTSRHPLKLIVRCCWLVVDESPSTAVFSVRESNRNGQTPRLIHAQTDPTRSRLLVRQQGTGGFRANTKIKNSRTIYDI